MPYDWVGPEVFMIHGGVVVYHTYRNDDINCPRECWFCLEETVSLDASDSIFDWRDLPKIPADKQDQYAQLFEDEREQAIAHAIDTGHFDDWEKDSPRPSPRQPFASACMRMAPSTTATRVAATTRSKPGWPSR